MPPRGDDDGPVSVAAEGGHYVFVRPDADGLEVGLDHRADRLRGLQREMILKRIHKLRRTGRW